MPKADKGQSGVELASKQQPEDSAANLADGLEQDTRTIMDDFAKLHGDFVNAVDRLGSSHALAMAISHAKQSMEWIGRHLHPNPHMPVPPAPPAPPPAVG